MDAARRDGNRYERYDLAVPRAELQACVRGVLELHPDDLRPLVNEVVAISSKIGARRVQKEAEGICKMVK